MIDQLTAFAQQTVESPNFWMFLAIGFIAQIFDGAIGMGFGVISSTTLTFMGYPRAAVSGAVNGAKVFTGLASGMSHIWHGNIDWRLLARLVAGGLAGAIPGALLVGHVKNPWVGVGLGVYLVGVGLFIILRAKTGDERKAAVPSRQYFIGISGGLLESISGIWGPLVTGTTVASGVDPRKAIGTVNLAEFFVAIAVVTVLSEHIAEHGLGTSVAALVVGALVSAPLAARITTRVPRNLLVYAVGGLIVLTSLVRIARDLVIILK